MNPFSFSLNWLLLPLLLAWSAAAYWAGDSNRNNAWLAKQAVIEQQAQKNYVAEVERGQTAAANSIAKQQQLQQSYSQLEEKFNEFRKRGPLVVFRGAPVAGEGVGHVEIGNTESSDHVEVGGSVGTAADAAIGLSLGAVWMWNSALGGADSPAGACGAADTTSPACAADSGLGIESAWANQAINAKSCAADRLRHQQLIDFVNKRANP
jgi:hypothetical protein